MSQLSINLRKTARSAVTRIFNDVPNFPTYDRLKSANVKSKLSDLKSRLQEFDLKILEENFSDVLTTEQEAKFMEESSNCEHYQDRITECLNRLLDVNPTIPLSDNGSERRSLLKSPQAPLPIFNSEPGEDFQLFIRNFEETIGKYNYTSYDKFLLLKQQIKGKALFLIESLSPDSQTFDEAKTLLTSALASRPVQISNIMTQMLNLNMSYSSEPFKYMSDMKKIVHAVCNQLNITIEEVLQFFFLKGMNDSFKNQLVMVTNNSNPTLTEIMEKFFHANDRYSVAENNYRKSKSDNVYNHNKKTATSMRADFSSDLGRNPFKNCTACNENNDHAINRCPKYVSAEAKIARLESLNGCVKCTNLDHDAARCKFRFRKPCNRCENWHFTFICPNLQNANDSYSSQRTKQNINLKRESSNKLVVTSSMLQSGSRLDSVLSTLTCCLGKGEVVRVLRDSGSQLNFISNSLLSKSEHTVIENNFNLTINGFNGSKKYSCQLISMPIFFNNGKTHVIEFVALPAECIDINIKLPKLSKIVQSFLLKDYRMADTFLSEGSDSIKNVNMILGSDASYCFHDEFVHFGEKSVFNNSDCGVMLMGNIPRLLSDVPHLLKNTSCESFEETGMLRGETDLSDLRAFSYACNIKSSSDLPHESPVFTRDENIIEFQGLEEKCSDMLNVDTETSREDSVELNDKLIDYLLNSYTRDETGRLIMPLLWNGKVKHLLPRNYFLARNILFSTLKKHGKNDVHMQLMHDNISELEEAGIIEKIQNLEDFLEKNPTSSFLANMPIFRLKKESTKCRIVFLSNLCEKPTNGIPTVSHNQSMHSGPCLNQKLSTSLMLLRFGCKLLVFDLKKAFCQIGLQENDMNKLLFLWVKLEKNGDRIVQAYRNLRLSFGLRPSPTILMTGLYIILMRDIDNDSEELQQLKRLMYALIYMDNGAVVMDTSESLKWAYDQLESIFSPYRFELQQFCSNDLSLREHIGLTEEKTELFGIEWDTNDDTLSAKKSPLNADAKTKRLILQTIAEDFDPHNINCPMLNRARLFLHKLQICKELGWDDDLSKDKLSEWRNICRQWNNSPTLSVPRSVGKRTDSYRLIAFTDSSQSIYGTVVYLHNINDNSVSFLLSKNHIVGTQLDSKTIPSLEFNGIVLGAETLVEINKELSGPLSVCPINICERLVFTDSLVSLNWIDSFSKLEKLNKRTVFIQNRLDRLDRICREFPITFSFIEGISNPADFVTRTVSYKQISNSNYLTGPSFITSKEATLCRADLLTVRLPSKLEGTPDCNATDSRVCTILVNSTEKLLPIETHSSYKNLLGVYARVFQFVNKLKDALKRKHDKFSHFECDEDSDRAATNFLIRSEQILHFEEAYRFFTKEGSSDNKLPSIIGQLNLFMDTDNLLRVGSKMTSNNLSNKYFPILLPKNSALTKLIIMHAHVKLGHSGVYSVLNQLRKQFWIPHCFSTVKKVLKQCIHCRRFNNRPVKLNQSKYREFRQNPTNTPFANVFLDYIGPYFVFVGEVKVKVWILCVSCLWTRAINMKISYDLSTTEFLRSFQLHCFDFGVPALVLSDLGSQIVSASDVIMNFLSDPDSQAHFRENNIESTKFDQYFKGCHKLGGLIESCVKLCRRLLSGSIGRNTLKNRDFEFFMEEAKHLVNRRPVAFKESLRDCSMNSLPTPITPEQLIHGRELVSMNLIPGLQALDDNFDPKNISVSADRLRDLYYKLRKVRGNLVKLYNEEFITGLIGQATNEKDRYSRVNHDALEVGDIVLLKEEHVKPANYPMGRIKSVQINDLGETTGAEVLKGATGEIVKRHSSVLIPLLKMSETNQPSVAPQNPEASEFQPVHNDQAVPVRRPKRAAAVVSRDRTRRMM